MRGRPRKEEKPVKTRGRSNALQRRETLRERLPLLPKRILSALAGLFSGGKLQQQSGWQHAGRTM